MWGMQCGHRLLLNTLFAILMNFQYQLLQEPLICNLCSSVGAPTNEDSSVHPQNSQSTNNNISLIPTIARRQANCKTWLRQSFFQGIYNVPFTVYQDFFKFQHFLEDQMLCPFCPSRPSEEKHHSLRHWRWPWEKRQDCMMTTPKCLLLEVETAGPGIWQWWNLKTSQAAREVMSSHFDLIKTLTVIRTMISP